jgi:hypothetical protein
MASVMQRLVPSTRQRVRRHTARSVNRRVDEQIGRNVRHYARHPREIDARLDRLDHEWDMERLLEANASALALTGTVLGLAVDKRFLALPVVVTAFLLQHAVQGWCPPVPVLRRLGIRTADEINSERYALKALRGDFGRRNGRATSAQAALKAVRH